MLPQKNMFAKRENLLIIHNRYRAMIRLISLTLLLVLSAIPTHARDIMVFSTYPDADTPNIVLARTVMTEVYNRLGMDVEIRYLPGYRMFRTANNGEVDGVLFNTSDIDIVYPNLSRVPTPVFSSQIWAFTKDKSIIINNWDSLQNYRIGYVRGFLLVKKRVENMQTEVLDEQEHMMLMLVNGRIDVAVDTCLTGLFTIQKLRLKGIKTTNLPLEHFSSFHYLHKKHADLIPKVEQMLSTMENKGRSMPSGTKS